MSCPACDRIQAVRRDAQPAENFVVELSESFVFLSDEQFYGGWCVLFLKDHHEHLANLPIQRQRDLWSDVSHVANAITRELKPMRINYECLGNQLQHIHWHVIPRYSDDPDPQNPIWLRGPQLRRGSMNPDERGEIIFRLARAIRTLCV